MELAASFSALWVALLLNSSSSLPPLWLQEPMGRGLLVELVLPSTTRPG